MNAQWLCINLCQVLLGPELCFPKVQQLNPDTFQPKEHIPAWSFEKQT